MTTWTAWLRTVGLVVLAACGTPDGALDLFVEAEESIVAGVEAGTGADDLRDGWTASFDRYVVVLGEIELQLATDADVRSGLPGLVALDLAAIAPGGEPFGAVQTQAGRYEVRYRQSSARGATNHGVATADFEEMVAGDCTYLVSGSITHPEGRSCPSSLGDVPSDRTPDADGCFPARAVSFRWCAAAPAVFGPCQSENGPSGVAVTEGGAIASLTIHGDHLFFNGFPEGEEGGIVRLAQWIADADLDLDGEVTRAELERIALADVVEFDGRYALGGAPPLPNLPGESTPEPMDDLWSYVRAQLRTQGHFNGEGECPVDTE